VAKKEKLKYTTHLPVTWSPDQICSQPVLQLIWCWAFFRHKFFYFKIFLILPFCSLD